MNFQKALNICVFYVTILLINYFQMIIYIIQTRDHILRDHIANQLTVIFHLNVIVGLMIMTHIFVVRTSHMNYEDYFWLVGVSEDQKNGLHIFKLFYSEVQVYIEYLVIN